MIYLDSLDNSIKAGDENDRLDLDVIYAKDLRDSIQKITGLKIGLATDWFRNESEVAENFEILIGNTSRPETAQFLDSIEFNEYGFCVIGNKIVVSGWNETTTELAVEKFTEFFKECIYVTELTIY